MPKKKKRSNTLSTLRPVTRNFVAKNQWQRGGAHEKPYKTKRQNAKQALKKEIRAGKSSSDFLFIDFALTDLHLQKQYRGMSYFTQISTVLFASH